MCCKWMIKVVKFLSMIIFDVQNTVRYNLSTENCTEVNGMLAVNYTSLRENMKSYMDQVTDDYETMIVTRKNNKKCCYDV